MPGIRRTGHAILWCCVLLLACQAVTVLADTPTPQPAIAEESQRYIARIELHTREEIDDLFDRAARLIDQEDSFSLGEPIAFVLHGPEVEYFARHNYGRFKTIVDKAAQLDAFRVIDVRVCATYLRQHNIDPENLPPFVEVVPFGPAEEQRLRQDGYVDF